MPKWYRIVTPLLLAQAVLGCGDPVQVRDQQGALALHLPSDAEVARQVMHTQSVQGASPASHDPADTVLDRRTMGGSLSAVSAESGKPEFIRTSTHTSFTSNQLAIVEGFAEFIGNQGRQLITVDLYKSGAPFVYRIETFDYKALLAGRHVMQHYARVALGANCGHRLIGRTNHYAWWLPGPVTPDLLPVANDSYSNDAEQAPCPPVRREEEELTPGGSGDPNDRYHTDEWYLCTWEVWYVDGKEVYRQLLYCSLA